MSESSLATYVHYSPNCTKPRQGTIKGVAIHCTAGGRNLPARSFADMNRFAVKQKNGASCHYVVGGDGSIAQVCREENRAWCTSNPIDHQIITIEVASDADGECKCNLAALNSLIKLLVDICQRNNIPRLLWRGDKALMGQWDKQNMVCHRWVARKSCPGDYLYGKHAAIAQAVNERLGAEPEDDDMDINKFKELWREMRKELQDNDASAYSEEARKWAVDNGIIRGGNSDEFNGMWEDMMTREQLVTVLYRFAQKFGLS